jgi:Na+-transporting NADH:ubiquinone oxidoreductase subunit NqrC
LVNQELTGSDEGDIVETLYFNFFVLPLGIIVAILVATVYYYANKEQIARRKTKKLVQAYIKEKAKQRQAMNKEIAKIDKLFENKSIDKETCERLKNVLTVMKEKKRGETKDIFEYVANND